MRALGFDGSLRDALSLQNAGSGARALVIGRAFERLTAWRCILALVWLEAVFDALAFGGRFAFLRRVLWRVGWLGCICRVLWWERNLTVSWYAHSAAVTWNFHRTDFLLSACLDHWAVLAVVCCDDLVVQTAMLNAFWISGVLPSAASLADLALFISAFAAVLGGDAGSAVERSAVRAVAAVISLDAGAGGAHGVTNVCTTERCRVAVLCGVLEQRVAALLDERCLMRTVLADRWILINTVWAILFTVAIDLLVQRAERHAG
jgi:hypothetical protein